MTSHRIFGAGLVGGYLAAALMACGHHVTVVARPAVLARRRAGVVLTDPQGHRAELPAPIIAEPGQTFDRLLWLTVRGNDVARALEQLPAHVGPDTTIICCQNGLGAEELVKAAFPDNRVLKAVIPFSVTELDRNHLHRGGSGVITVERDPTVFSLLGSLHSPLLTVRFSGNIESLRWARLQLSLVNAINALADIPLREMLLDRSYRLVYARCVRELQAVAAAQSIGLPRLLSITPLRLPHVLELPDWMFRQAARAMLQVEPYTHTSMWWDLYRGKRTEVDRLNGAVVAHGRRLGVPTPVNERILRWVHSVERGERQPGLSAKAMLMDEVARAPRLAMVDGLEVPVVRDDRKHDGVGGSGRGLRRAQGE